MGFLTSLRVSSVAWVLLPTLVVSWVMTEDRTRFAVEGYGAAAANSALEALFVPAAACAGCAAWEAWRLRRAGIWRLPHGRGRYAVAANALAPVALLGAAGLLTSLASAWVELRAVPDLAGVPMLLTGVLVLVSHSAVGFLLGSLLPGLLSAPLMLLASYLWMGMPATMEPPLRYLNGLPTGSVQVTETFAVGSWAAPGLLALGLVAGTMAAVAPLLRQVAVRVLATAGCVTAAALGAYAIVADWEYEPRTVPRAFTPVCAGEAPAVCVPPEYRAALPGAREAADEVVPLLAAAGFTVPERILMQSDNAPLPENTWLFYTSPRLDDSGHRTSIAYSPLPPSRRCPLGTAGDWEAEQMARTWLWLTAGEPRTGDRFEETMGAAEEIRALPVAEQQEWFRDMEDRLTVCLPEVL
ncbi:hypothetical protein ACGFX7_06790 [Streptomyces harbinensis]|uniref:DUF7224 domain-containing protein n=2 Tax=Streptomyces harbinensis TaxID=1176198 RepID=UPI003713A8BE